METQAPRLWLTGLLNTECITAGAMVVQLLMIVRVSLSMDGGLDAGLMSEIGMKLIVMRRLSKT